MKAATKRAAERQLGEFLDGNPITEGMTLRVSGRHHVLGRPDPCADGPFPDLEPDDRLRLTHIGGVRYGLSIRLTQDAGRRRRSREPCRS